jgi:hypothetical protein
MQEQNNSELKRRVETRAVTGSSGGNDVSADQLDVQGQEELPPHDAMVRKAYHFTYCMYAAHSTLSIRMQDCV